MMKKTPKSFGAGKLIDTWVYDVESLLEEEVESEDPEAEPAKRKIVLKKIEMEVRMEKKGDDSAAPPYPVKDVKFVVSCDDPKFVVEGTDIEEVRAAAYSRCAEHFAIEWERYYLVEVQHQRPYGGGDGTGFTFEYREVYRGVSIDGKVLKREYTRWRRDYEWEIKPWPGRFTTEGGKTIACIPANEENTKALENFGNRIDVLRTLIEDALRPEAIEETLRTLSSNNLLPPAPEKPKKRKKEESAIDV